MIKQQRYKVYKNTHYILKYNNNNKHDWNPEPRYFSMESLCEEIANDFMFENSKFRDTCFENNAESEYFIAVKNRYVRLLMKTIKPIEVNNTDTIAFNEFEQKISNILRNDWNPIGFGNLLPKDEYDSYVPRIYKLLEENASQKIIEVFLEHIETTVIGLTRKKQNEAKLIAHTSNIANKLCKIKINMGVQ